MNIAFGIGIFLVGIAQGFLNTIAGGGSLLALPMLTFMGMDIGVANATNRIGVLIQTLVGAAAFRKHNVLSFSVALPVAGAAMLGAVAGTMLAVQIDKRALNIVIAVLISCMAVLLVYKPRMWEGHSTRTWPKWGVYLLFFAIGIYGGFIQAGVGFFLTWALAVALGCDLIHGNAMKVVIVGAFTTVSLAIFIWKGLVVYSVGFVLAAGNSIGAYLGARFTVMKGNTWIRWSLAIVVVISAAQMIYSVL